MKRSVRRIGNENGKQRLEFFDHGNGFFSFEEECEQVEEAPGVGPLSHWECTYQSGLYATLAEAEKEAENTLAWLRGRL